MRYLNRNDVSFLKSELNLSDLLLEVLESIELGGELSDDYAEDLRELCTDRFDEIGLDENYEPTAKGRVFESLIDKLFIG